MSPELLMLNLFAAAAGLGWLHGERTKARVELAAMESENAAYYHTRIEPYHWWAGRTDKCAACGRMGVYDPNDHVG